MDNKQFKIDATDLKQFIKSRIACIASDRITVDGERVGYMYREESDIEYDSGWRLFSGTEDQAYTDVATNFSYYAINTIANYDPDILPFIDLPIGTALERKEENGAFVFIL